MQGLEMLLKLISLEHIGPALVYCQTLRLRVSLLHAECITIRHFTQANKTTACIECRWALSGQAMHHWILVFAT